MEGKAKIADRHLGPLAALLTMGEALLSLPVLAVDAAGRLAWLVAVLAGGVGFFALAISGRLSQRFATKTFTKLVEGIIGRSVGKWLGLLYALLLSLNATVDLRLSLDSVIGLYFFRVPAIIPAIILTVTALSLCWFGPVHMSRLPPVLLGVLFVAFLFTFPFLLRHLEPAYLIPVNDPHALNPATRAFWAALCSFRVGLYLPILMPYLSEPRRALRTFGLWYWAGWCGVALAVTTPVMLFGPEGATALSQPFLFAVGTIRLPTWPFERIEILVRLVYNMTLLFAVGARLLAGGLVLSAVFAGRSARPFVVLVSVLSLLPIWLIPREIPGEVFSGWTLIITVALVYATFSLLWLVYWIRGLHHLPPGLTGGTPK